MARFASAPVGLTTSPFDQTFGHGDVQLHDGGIAEFDDVTGGMVDGISRSKIPQNSQKLLVNSRTRLDWVGRREGTGELGTKPDSNRVIKVVTFIGEDLVRKLCRVTQTSFHVWDGDSWQAFTITGSLKGTAVRATVAQLFGKMYVSFNVADGIWEVDFITKALTRVDQAPSAKFIGTFAERIIAANVSFKDGGRFPSGYAWCANSDPQDWEGETAGFNDLIEDSLGNEITGLAILEREAVIVRRRSIVHVSRQPFGIAPFRADTIIRGLGSDLPYTTVRVPGGLIFADSTTNSVYFYQPGSRPVSLTAQIRDLLFADLGNAQFAEAAWEPYESEYHLGLMWTNDDDLIARRWVCNMSKGHPIWSYDDSPVVTTIGEVLLPPDPTSIDELTGTINALSGSIDSLSSRGVPFPRLCLGISTGEVVEFSYEHDHDWNGTEFTHENDSQNLGSISRRRTMKDLELKCSIPSDGEITIEQSRDRSTWVNTKTEDRTGSSGFQYVRLPSTQITGDDLYWRIKTSIPGFKLHSWWTRIMEKGRQVGGQQ